MQVEDVGREAKERMRERKRDEQTKGKIWARPGQIEKDRNRTSFICFSHATKAQVPGFIDTAESGKKVNCVLMGVPMRIRSMKSSTTKNVTSPSLENLSTLKEEPAASIFKVLNLQISKSSHLAIVGKFIVHCRALHVGRVALSV